MGTVILWNKRTKRTQRIRDVKEISRNGYSKFKLYHGRKVTEFSRWEFEIIETSGTIETTNY